jgi:hypothetical protein
MMTERRLTEAPGPEAASGTPGERIRRLQRRRRLMREELLAVAVLLVFLAATVAVLATQWLASGPSATATAYAAATGPPQLTLTLVPYGGTT